MTPQELSVLRLVCCAPVAVGSCEPEMSELAQRGYVEQFSERVGLWDRPMWRATDEGRDAIRAQGGEMKEKSYPSFIVRWWLRIPMSAGAVVWWAGLSGQARKLWAGLFGSEAEAAKKYRLPLPVRRSHC